MPLLRSNPLSPRSFLLGMLGALVADLLVIVAMVLLGEYTKTRGRLLLTFLVLAPFCLSAIPPSALLRRRRRLPVAWTGLVASDAGFVLVAVGIWATPDPDAYWQTAVIVSIAAASTFQASWLLLLTPVRAFARRLLWAVMGVSLLAALLSVVGIIGEIKPAAYWWVVFLLVIAGIVGSLALLARDHRRNTGAIAED